VNHYEFCEWKAERLLELPALWDSDLRAHEVKAEFEKKHPDVVVALTMIGKLRKLNDISAFKRASSDRVRLDPNSLERKKLEIYKNNADLLTSWHRPEGIDFHLEYLHENAKEI